VPRVASLLLSCGFERLRKDVRPCEQDGFTLPRELIQVNGVTASGEDRCRDVQAFRECSSERRWRVGCWSRRVAVVARVGPRGPDLDTSTRIGLGQIAGEARSRSPVHDRRHTPGVDVLRRALVPSRTGHGRAHSRLIDEATTGGVTGDTLLAAWGSGVALYAGAGRSATVERPGVRKSATDGAEKRLAASRCEVGRRRGPANYDRRPDTCTQRGSVHCGDHRVCAGQTRVPDKMVVMCDKCTDRTAEIASRYEGVTVSHSLNNMDARPGR